MKADVILGLQWGDEGKGKIVDLLAPGYDIIARFQGGPNAGHTIEINGSKHVLHLIPSGIFHPNITNLIGNGVIIDPYIFLQELTLLRGKGLQPENQLLISNRAHLILPTHRLLDACSEKCKKDKKIGSTLKGIGPAYTDKTARNGLRAGDIFNPGFKDKYNTLKELHLRQLKSFEIPLQDILMDGHDLVTYENNWFSALEEMKKLAFVDSEIFLNDSLASGKRVLAEGAQGTLLDIDFGSYPFVTSSSTSIGGVCTGLGIPPSRIGDVYGVFKAYCTRVGNGPFPTELHDETGQLLRDKGNEYGSTTGRPRRCGWLDLPALRYSILINGVTRLVMMKADVMNALTEIKLCTSYNVDNKHISLPSFVSQNDHFEPVYATLQGWAQPLPCDCPVENQPKNFVDYIEFIETSTKSKISVISLGPERNQSIYKAD
ncbi:MAG: adenylosuccinate synthase [Bacteroidetes bacterium]|nr:adenylosuccinate synthase [Bacteroidota bacterium]